LFLVLKRFKEILGISGIHQRGKPLYANKIQYNPLTLFKKVCKGTTN